MSGAAWIEQNLGHVSDRLGRFERQCLIAAYDLLEAGEPIPRTVGNGLFYALYHLTRPPQSPAQATANTARDAKIKTMRGRVTHLEHEVERLTRVAAGAWKRLRETSGSAAGMDAAALEFAYATRDEDVARAELETAKADLGAFLVEPLIVTARSQRPGHNATEE